MGDIGLANSRESLCTSDFQAFLGVLVVINQKWPEQEFAETEASVTGRNRNFGPAAQFGIVTQQHQRYHVFN